MSKYRFNYRTLSQLREDLDKLNIKIPVSEDLSVLNETIRIGKNSLLDNRLVIQPMEGCDALENGSPSPLTTRRYLRYAESKAGMIWFEATAVNKGGRANKNQLFLNKGTVKSFAELVKVVRAAASAKYGKAFSPYLVLQLTHAGRYGENKEVVTNIDEKGKRNPAGYRLLTDDDLEKLVLDYLQAAELAQTAGFDAVDIKMCHRYLLSELLGAHQRPGKYGGAYENRTRLVKKIIVTIKQNVEIDLAVRINAYDAIPYPFGWSTTEEGKPDLTETYRLVHEMADLGVKIFNITASSPYVSPHISRPYDKPAIFGYESKEHPLLGVARLLYLARDIQNEEKEQIIVGTGYSWLRQFAPYIAAGVIKEGWAKLIGFGRQSFAYPDFAYDILVHGQMNPRQVCVTCSKCVELKAQQMRTGCVIRDSSIYLPYYQESLKANTKKD